MFESFWLGAVRALDLHSEFGPTARFFLICGGDAQSAPEAGVMEARNRNTEKLNAGSRRKSDHCVSESKRGDGAKINRPMPD